MSFKHFNCQSLEYNEIVRQKYPLYSLLSLMSSIHYVYIIVSSLRNGNYILYFSRKDSIKHVYCISKSLGPKENHRIYRT